MQDGNSKPFYRHLKGTKQTKIQMNLKTNDSTTTENTYECTTLLNKYFHSQFNKEHN